MPTTAGALGQAELGAVSQAMHAKIRDTPATQRCRGRWRVQATRKYSTLDLMSLVSVSRSISTEKLANEATLEWARYLLQTKKSVSFASLTLYSAMRAPMGS